METLNIKDKAIGSGITFPFNITQGKDGKGLYPVVGEVNLIENNIHSLVLYPIGFRFRFEEYGIGLQTYLEEPNTQALMFIIKRLLKTTIAAYESRIKLTQIESIQYEDWLVNRLYYQLKGTPLEAYTDVAMNRNI